MNEPYDDAAPFPPEWEGERKNPLDEIMRMLMNQMPPVIRDELMNDARNCFSDALGKFAKLSVSAGASSFERVVCQRKDDAAKSGFHAALHFNINQESLDTAGLTAKDVEEVWEIHAQQLADFFESIKRCMIDKGLADDSPDEHRQREI